MASQDNMFTRKFAWYKYSERDDLLYKQKLSTCTVSNILPDSAISCTNLLCDNPKHKECLDNFLAKMVDDLVKCSSHIPKIKAPTSNNTVPGWSEHVKPYKDDAIFWKRQWDQLGKPPQGLVAHYMRRSHADYLYAIGYV